MADIFLGVDAGGTKTHAALMNSDGDILGLGVAATGNWERVGFDACALALSSAVDGALRESGHSRGDISDATFALAGIDWDSDATVMQSIVRGFGLNCVPTVMNDAFAVLYAGTPDGRGCASIAGTGGKTVAFDGVRSTTTLGMSLGEGGGAGQIVAAGSLATLAKLGENPPAGSRVRPLAVSGAFHTSTMAPAVPVLATLVSELEIKDPKISLISNKDGAVVSDGNEVLERIVGQVAGPVRWDLCMETLAKVGVTGVIEVPPAGTLVGLIKRAQPNIETFALKSPEDLAGAKEFIARHGGK